MTITLRRARPEDRLATYEVEKKSTPGLSYLPYVFDEFVNDAEGEFIVAEESGQLTGCGKFTVLPDGSAWLETLRVIPKQQGRGIGKMFYRRFLEIARAKAISTLRMYTGVKNLTSKGLAERFGFTVAGTYRGQKHPCQPDLLRPAAGAFEPVTDPENATRLLLAYREQWAGFLVINRTFYAITPALAAFLAGRGMLYHDRQAGSVIALGARFMPQQALHIGFWAGDLRACLSFALQAGMQRGVESLSCYSPVSAADIQSGLAGNNFQTEASDVIVMEARIS